MKRRLVIWLNHWTVLARLIRWMDNWRIWVVIAYMGLCIFGVLLWNNQTRTTSILAEHKANAAAQYQQCVKSIPFLRRFNHFAHSVQDVHDVLLINAEATHRATKPGTAVYRAQIRNLDRLRRASREANELSPVPTPTVAKCKAQRDRTLRLAGGAGTERTS